MRTITINNREFMVEKCTARDTLRVWNDDVEGADALAITKVYGRPSTTKVNIWCGWCVWLQQILRSGGHGHLYIASHNCNFFTIRGWVANDDTESEIVPIYVTYRYNRAFM